MKKTVAFKTLGCRLNQFETDAIMSDFYKSGYDIVDFQDQADIYIVNTCTVTNQGDHKSKLAINQALNHKQGALMVVTGCMAESQKEYLEQRGDIQYIVDNKSKISILPLVESHFSGEILDINLLPKDVFGFSFAEKSFHTRSMIKIQDGCDNFCTFCIVPSVRGRALSRKDSEILDNIHKVLDLGYKEIVLTGVNISRYDYNGLNFTKLLGKILAIQGDFRVRISSIEPEGFDKPLFDLFGHEKLCPHLHICLQSGSDPVLLKMRRMYSVSQYMHIVEQIKKMYPGFNFTTDIMVGFPGETETDFSNTCNVIREVGFSHIHTFKYSVRKGTRAERMPDQIPEKIKQQRSITVRDLAQQNKQQYRKQFIGRNERVLIEKVSRSGIAKGYGEHYIPVEFHAQGAENNMFRNVNILGTGTESQDFILKGKMKE